METCANKTCICRQSSRNQSRSPTFQFYVLPGKQGSQLRSTFPIEKKILPVGTETRLGCGPGALGLDIQAVSVIRWHIRWLKPTVLSNTGSMHTRSRDLSNAEGSLHSQAPDTSFAVTLRPNMLPLTPASQWKCSFSPKFQCWSRSMSENCSWSAMRQQTALILESIMKAAGSQASRGGSERLHSALRVAVSFLFTL